MAATEWITMTMHELDIRTYEPLVGFARETDGTFALVTQSRDGAKTTRVKRVVLCVGYLGQQVEDFVGDGSQYGLAVDYCYDGPALLGTGGALRRALGQLGTEFLVMYGDSWLDAAFAPVVDAFRASGKPALMTVYRNSDRWDRSNVWFENGHIRAYDKEQRLPQMQHIDWGLSMVKAEVPIRLSRPRDPLSVEFLDYQKSLLRYLGQDATAK